MDHAINWKDDYTNTKYRKVLTKEYLGIPGLQLFGKQIRTSATESLPPHFHQNCYEIVYITSGNPSFFVQGKNYHLSGGDVFITKPDQIHSTNSVPVTLSEMYWMQIELDPDSSFLFLNQDAIVTLRNKLSALTCPKITTDGDWIKMLFSKAFQAAASGDNPQLISQYLSLLLYMILDFSEKTTFKLTPDIGRAVNYILDHIEEPLSFDNLAKISALSVSQFKQKFKKQMGIAPRQFINLQKIEYSKELLQEGYSIQEISEMLNFVSNSYFTTVFKKFNSCTPSEYLRRQNMSLYQLH